MWILSSFTKPTLNINRFALPDEEEGVQERGREQKQESLDLKAKNFYAPCLYPTIKGYQNELSAYKMIFAKCELSQMHYKYLPSLIIERHLEYTQV